MSVEILDKDVTNSSPLRAIVHDRDSCRPVAVRGTVGESDRLDIRPTAHRPLPTQEEYAAAFEALLHDDRLADLIERGGMQSYQPMPPYADIEHPTASSIASSRSVCAPRTEMFATEARVAVALSRVLPARAFDAVLDRQTR